MFGAIIRFAIFSCGISFSFVGVISLFDDEAVKNLFGSSVKVTLKNPETFLFVGPCLIFISILGCWLKKHPSVRDKRNDSDENPWK